MGNTILHITLHFAVPALVAASFFRQRWWFAYLVMVATMVVDFDHLLATPIYDPGRCSIGFHPLHGMVPMVLYLLLLLHPRLRLVGIGLLIHMGLDSIDCQLTSGVWSV